MLCAVIFRNFLCFSWTFELTVFVLLSNFKSTDTSEYVFYIDYWYQISQRRTSFKLINVCQTFCFNFEFLRNCTFPYQLHWADCLKTKILFQLKSCAFIWRLSWDYYYLNILLLIHQRLLDNNKINVKVFCILSLCLFTVMVDLKF